MLAAEEGHTAVVEALLAAQAAVDVQTKVRTGTSRVVRVSHFRSHLPCISPVGFVASLHSAHAGV
jgi:hypothetical protein